MVFLLGSGRPLNDSSHETAVTHQETWHLRSGMVEDIILDQLHSFFFFVELVQDNMSTTPLESCHRPLSIHKLKKWTGGQELGRVSSMSQRFVSC